MGIKISELPQTSQLTDSDVIPIVQSGDTKKIAVNNIITNSHNTSQNTTYSSNYIDSNFNKVNVINEESSSTTDTYSANYVNNVIETIENKLTPLTLFTGNIEQVGAEGILSDSVSNYEKLVISCYHGSSASNVDTQGIIEFYPDLQAKGNANLDWSYPNVGYQYHYGCNFTIQNSKITITGGWAMVYDGSGNVAGHFEGGNEVHITKILGYKK